MEDGLAREGTLARCNQDRDGTATDIECENARRAAAAVAVREEQARRAELERESQRKLVALRTRTEQQRQAELQAALEAKAAADALYEAQWRDPSEPGADALAAAAAGGEAPTFGAPLGPVTSSADDAWLDDVYAGLDVRLPARPQLELAAVVPPPSDLKIVRPELALEDVAIVPQPLEAVADGQTVAR
jgi:hypothetical protein